MKCRVSEEESKHFHSQKDALEFSYADKRHEAEMMLINGLNANSFEMVEDLSCDHKDFIKLQYDVGMAIRDHDIFSDLVDRMMKMKEKAIQVKLERGE